MAIERIDYEKCISCQKCYEICPMDVFQLMGHDRVYIAYEEDCARCLLCSRVCPTEAIEVNAKPIIPILDPFQN
jgi:NAD-dependent dihydropyrimidine dehydrogenase PreA subunit